MKIKLTRLISLIICIFMVISVISGAAIDSAGFNFRMPFGQDAETSLLEESSGSGELAAYADIEDEIIKYDNEPESTPDPAARPFDGDWDNAMHFFIRHWHSDPITSTSFQHDPDQDNATDRYFVILEGYIVPVEEYTYKMRGDGTFDPENLDENGDHLVSECKYKFCLVYQDSGEFDIYDENNQSAKKEYNEGDMREIYYDGGFVHKSEYIASINPQTGTITLKAAPTPNDSFAGLSISSGAGAIGDSVDRNLMPITYKPDIHLVKGHAFYVREAMSVDGTDEKMVFGENGLVTDPEQDTTWIYKNDSGDIIITDDNGRLFTEKDPETKEVNGQNYTLTKVHDNEEGLHTDKTASVAEGNDDGRTFNVDLEAWYSEGYAPQVGMVIDASGSMAFASDIPSPINVNNLGANVAGQLKDKIGFVQKNDGFLKSEDSQIIGYYEISQNSGSGTYDGWRNWYLNSVKKTPSTDYTNMDKNKDFAKAVSQSTPNDIDFSGAVPVGHWSDLKPFIDSAPTGWGNVPANFSGINGFNLTSKGTYGNTGFMPEVQPKDPENFTISFSLTQAKDELCKNDIEILYIGAEQGVNNYFHVIRSGTDIIATVGNTTVATISNAFTRAETHTISFVFNDGNVTTYYDGSFQGRAENIETLGGTTVVFAPFEDNNTQIEYFHVDSIYLFDTAFNSDEINNLKSVAGEDVDLARERITGAFLTPAQQRLILNPHNTDNSYLGVSGYTYYVYDPTDSANGKVYIPLGYYNDPNALAGAQDVNGAGWYSVSHKNWNSIKNGTAKATYGIPDNKSFTDKITAGVRTIGAGEGAAPNLDADYNKGNTGKIYTSAATGPVKFYIDSRGYLRCFWANSSNPYSSYVYELTDAQYVRTEALRRAVGSFITNLSENSPSAEVSAVKFSAANTPADQMVLLDWTADPTESVKVLSASRGDGTFTGYEASKNGTKQYSYGLTGGTNTVEGLKAFNTQLAAKKRTQDDYDKIPKYLIIFTDGKDDNISNNNTQSTVDAANTLKQDGYTIFTVLLDGGTFDLDGDDKNVKDFLVSLSGNSNPGTNSEDYFFSIDAAKKQLKKEGWTDEQINSMNDADILTRIFQIEILSQITQPLENYNVKDYIDPRFDLVDAKGIVWQLKANGKVVKSDGTVIEDVNDGTGTKITISANSNPKAREPYLRYNSEKDMYYLQWDKQNIPGSAVGANRLTVWNAQITIRAKENFIGGNAILVGGNEEKQNYVYRKDDPDPHSDAEHAGKANRGDDSSTVRSISTQFYPSKGFPRVTVNVLPQGKGSSSENIIYMGEKLSLNDVIGQFMQWEGSTDLDDLTSGLYWEYILRYADKFHGGKTDELMSVFQAAEDGGVRSIILPYYYLPNNPSKSADPNKSQNGTAAHINDCLGYLRYTWKVGDRRYPEGDERIKDTYTRDSELTVKFIPFTEQRRLSETNYTVTTDTTIGELKRKVMKDGTGEIDEDLLTNLLNIVLSHVFSGTGLNEELFGAILDDAKTKITDDNDNSKFVDVFVDICKEHGIKDNSTLEAIRAKFSTEGAIRAEGAAINEKLIKESAYKWEKDYKSAAGDMIKIQDAIDDRMINDVVSGEIVLRMDIKKDDINYLLDKGYIQKDHTITYAADLVWEHGSTKEVIGTFNAEYTVTGKLEEDAVVYATLTLTNQNFIHDYGSDLKSTAKDNGWHRDKMNAGAVIYDVPTYGLPIGTYTLENVQAGTDTGTKHLYFEDIKNLTIGEEDYGAFTDSNKDVMESKIYYDRWYKAGDNVIDESGNKTEYVIGEDDSRIGTSKPAYYPDYDWYPAPVSGNTVYLGTKPVKEDATAYINQRYALLGVEVKRVPDLPNTGGHGVVWIVITGVLLLFIGLIIFIKRRRRAA